MVPSHYKALESKGGVPNLVTYLNRAPIFELSVSPKTDAKKTCFYFFEEIGLYIGSNFEKHFKLNS